MSQRPARRMRSSDRPEMPRPGAAAPWEAVSSAELDLGYEVAFPFYSQAEPPPAAPAAPGDAGEPARGG